MRQRAAGLGRVAVVLALTVAAVGCQARSSMEAAQTAVTVAQTAIPALPTGLPSIADQIRPLLGNALIDIRTTPDDAASDAVTNLTITGTDVTGTLSQLDTRARDGAANAALLLASRYYPRATIVLDVRDASGATLVHASREAQ